MGNYFYKRKKLYEQFEKEWEEYWNNYSFHVNKDLNYYDWPVNEYNKNITSYNITSYVVEYMSTQECNCPIVFKHFPCRCEIRIAAFSKKEMMKENFIRSKYSKEFMKEGGVGQELISVVWHPRNIHKFKNWDPWTYGDI